MGRKLFNGPGLLLVLHSTIRIHLTVVHFNKHKYLVVQPIELVERKHYSTLTERTQTHDLDRNYSDGPNTKQGAGHAKKHYYQQ